MGLDAYLYKQHSIPEQTIINISGETLNKIDYVMQEVGYWRKANIISDYFKNILPNNVDTETTQHVPQQHLETMLKDLKQIIKHRHNKKTNLNAVSEFWPPQHWIEQLEDFEYKHIEATIQILEGAIVKGAMEDFFYEECR